MDQGFFILAKMKSNNQAREIPLKLVLTGILFLAAIFFFGFLAKVVVIGKNDLFDSHVFEFFEGHTSPLLVDVMNVITFFGSRTFLLPAYILLVCLLLWKKEKRLAFDVALIGITADLLKLALKNGFQRQRPEMPLLESLQSYSFPSGHALSSFIFFSAIIYVLWKQENMNRVWKWLIAVLLILFSILIGLSRIILRYHYPSDVIAGFCIAFSWVLLSLWLLNKLHFYLQNRRSKI